MVKHVRVLKAAWDDHTPMSLNECVEVLDGFDDELFLDVEYMDGSRGMEFLGDLCEEGSTVSIKDNLYKFMRVHQEDNPGWLKIGRSL